MKKKSVINWVDIGQKFSSSIFWLSGGIFFISTITLYTTLLAETNMLSFTKKADKIKNIVETHNVKDYGSGFLPKYMGSDKTPLEFNQDDVIKTLTDNTFMNLLNESKFPIIHFIKLVLTNMISNNWTMITALFGLAYKLPESFVMIASIYITPFIWFIMFFINMFMAFIYHIIHFKQLFTTYDVDSNPPTFTQTFTSFSAWCTYFVYVIFLMVPLIVIGLPTISMIYSVITPLLIPCETKHNHKSYDFSKFVYDLIVYKRQVIMLLISFTLLNVIYTNIGTTEAMSCLGAILFLMTFTKLYSQYIPDSKSKSK
jgi:hypothetical protein